MTESPSSPEEETESEPESTGEPIGRRVLRETTAFVILHGASSVIGWIGNLALARLLTTRDFGVFGICTFYVGIGSLLGDGGLGAALVRRRAAVTKDELRVTFTALLVLSSVLASVIFALAPTLGGANDFSPDEITVLRCMAPIYFLGALRVVPYVKLQRELAFGIIGRIEVLAHVVRYSVAVGFAAGGFGAWSLVIAALAQSGTQMVLAFIAAPGWVGLGFKRSVFARLLGFGFKVQGQSILAYFKDNVSRGLLGRWLGPSNVGLFDFGLGYVQVPVQAANGFARVQFPVYARLDRDDPALEPALRAALRTMLLLGIPFLGVLVFGADWIIPLIYGDQWLGSVVVVIGLAPNMLCGLLLSPLFGFMQGQGAAGRAVLLFAAWTVSTWALAAAGLFFVEEEAALAWVAWAHSIPTVLVTVAIGFWVLRYLGWPSLKGLGVVVVAGMAGGAAGGASRFFGLPEPSSPLIFLAVFLVTLFALDGRGVIRDIRAVLEARKSRREKK